MTSRVTLLAVVALLATGSPSGAAPAEVRTLVGDLAFPTNLAPAADGTIYFTEKETGRVRAVGPRGHLRAAPVAELAVAGGAERGLLGIALAPDGRTLFLYLSDASDGRNRVVAIPVGGGSPRVIFEGLPSVSGYHNGGDLTFGPDGALYVVTGEAHDPDLAQDPDSVGGKLLRLDPDGSVPPDNPDPASPVYASGIRNSFGICIDPRTGRVWETENGPDRDEINRVPPGANLGWPLQLGRGGEPRFVDPVLVYPEVIVPTGCAIGGDGALYFGDFSGALHRVDPTAEPATDEIVARFADGITDVAARPGGDLLVATTSTISTVALDGQASGPTADPSVPSPPTTGRRSPEVPSGSDDGPLPVWLALGVAAIAVSGVAALVLRRRDRQVRGRFR